MEIKNIQIKNWFYKSLKDWQSAVLCYHCKYTIIEETEKAIKINVLPKDRFLNKRKPQGYDMWFPKSAIEIIK